MVAGYSVPFLIVTSASVASKGPQMIFLFFTSHEFVKQKESNSLLIKASSTVSFYLGFLYYYLFV